MIERKYIRGNKKHWRDVCKYVYGVELGPNSKPGICSDDTAIFVLNKVGSFNLYTDGVIYDAITTNPHWHEIKPWEKHYEPKPFDKVLGWYDNENAVFPDIFLYKTFDTYSCARGCYNHVKSYDEEVYLKSLEKSTDDE